MKPYKIKMNMSTTINNMNIFSTLCDSDVESHGSSPCNEDTFDSEFPTLCNMAPPVSKSQSNGVKRAERRDRNGKESNDITDLLITYRPRYERGQYCQTTERSKAFERIADKNSHAKSLARTKPCFHVVPKMKNGKMSGFGVCYRLECTFAHSLEEFNIAPCAFDDECIHMNCHFLHTCESVDEFYERTGLTSPNLPEVAGKHRQPSKPNSKNFGPKALGSAVGSRSKQLGAPKLAIDLTPKVATDLSTDLSTDLTHPKLERTGPPVETKTRVTVPTGWVANAIMISSQLGLSNFNIIESDDEITDGTIMRVPEDTMESAFMIGLQSGLSSFQVIQA